MSEVMEGMEGTEAAEPVTSLIRGFQATRLLKNSCVGEKGFRCSHQASQPKFFHLKSASPATIRICLQQ